VIDGEAETAVHPPARLGASKRTWLILALLVGAAVLVVVLLESGVLSSSTPAAGVSDNTYPTSAARVRKGTLVSQTEVSATLGYAGTATIEMPSGTAPSSLTQAQQQVTTAEATEQSANATLSADTTAQAQAQASLAAAKAKEAVDCAGTGAAQAPSSGGTGDTGGGGGGGACANDGQSVSTEQQAVTQDQAKVSADRVQVSSAQTAVAAAQTNLASAGTSASTWGQTSTFTSLPTLGAIIRRGQSLFAVSDQPAFLMYGPVGAWRAFERGMSPGRDVAELNANLQALGYGSGTGLEGDAFTSATASAIDAFQAAHGLSQTGDLLLGSVVFEPGAVRVTAVTPTVGATVAPGPVLSVTSTKREVVIDLDAAQQTEVKVGDPVTITLPDNSTTPGRITFVGTVATTPSSSNQGGGDSGNSSPTIEVDVTPTDPAATGKLDQAPVTVSITTSSVKNAVYVPVSALLALASGGYAVEEIGAGGVHRLVGVQVGLFDDQSGDVQISGSGVEPGQRVVIPGE
jgi:peptidoglycan hydrolase-like protein with peptidoglycan-binding domain